MYTAEEPLRTYYWSKSRSAPGQTVTWEYRREEFAYLPVFTGVPQRLSSLFESLEDAGFRTARIVMDYSLPEENKVFGRCEYVLLGAMEQNRSPAALEEIISSFDACFLEGMQLSLTHSTDSLSLDILIPVTDIRLTTAGEPVNLEELDKKMEDPDMIRTMIDLFCSQTPGRIESWYDAYRIHDFVTAHRIVHSIKGSALNLCAHGLARRARELEMELKQGRTAEAADFMKEIEQELRLVVKFLGQKGRR